MSTRVVLITGAGSGIGLGLAKAFLLDGERVVGTGRSAQRLQAAARELEPAGDGDRFLPIAADCSSPDAVEKLFQQAVARFGRVDVLVNNAGIFTARPFIDFTPADIEAQIDANLRATLYCSQQAARLMCAQGDGGRIINITAALALQPDNRIPALMNVILKGAIHHATRGLALELAPFGVTVNAVAPGVVATAMHPPQALGAYARMHPLGRVASIDDICSAVRYLSRAEHITGAVLPVDGGCSAGQWTPTAAEES